MSPAANLTSVCYQPLCGRTLLITRAFEMHLMGDH